MSKKSASGWSNIFGIRPNEFNEKLKDNGYLDGEPGDYTATDKASGHYDVMNNGFGTYKWASGIVDSLFGSDMGNIDWYCNECESYLNSQSNFTGKTGHHKCQICGCINPISSSEIR